MIFIEFRRYEAKKQGTCGQCGEKWKPSDVVYHLPKGRFHQDKPRTICAHCFKTHVVNDCHGH